MFSEALLLDAIFKMKSSKKKRKKEKDVNIQWRYLQLTCASYLKRKWLYAKYQDVFLYLNNNWLTLGFVKFSRYSTDEIHFNLMALVSDRKQIYEKKILELTSLMEVRCTNSFVTYEYS